MEAQQEDKRSYRDKVAALFRTLPGIWIDGADVANIGGYYAWRTRISDCRKQLGMVIENRQQREPNGRTRSQYRYVPLEYRLTAKNVAPRPSNGPHPEDDRSGITGRGR